MRSEFKLSGPPTHDGPRKDSYIDQNPVNEDESEADWCDDDDLIQEDDPKDDLSKEDDLIEEDPKDEYVVIGNSMHSSKFEDGRPAKKRRQFWSGTNWKASAMRERWSKIHIISESTLRGIKRFTNNCFRVVNFAYLRHHMKYKLELSYPERRLKLKDMCEWDGPFYFDTKVVCGTFLLLPFRFSRCLQASLKHGTERSITSSKLENDTMATRSPSIDCSSDKRGRIISFL